MNQYDLYIDHYFKDHSCNILLYPVSYQFLVTDSFPVSYNFVIGIKNYQLILKYLGFEQRDALLFGRLEQFEKVKKNIDNLIDHIFVENDKRLYEMLVLQADNDFDKYINVELFNTSRWLNKSKESILSAINIVDKTKSAEIWHKFIETLSVVINELILSNQKLAAPQKSNYLNLFSDIATDRNSKNAKVISNLPLFTKEKLATVLNVVKLIKQGKQSILGKDIHVIKSNTLLNLFNDDLSLNRVGINDITTYFDFLWGERSSKDLVIIDKVYSNDLNRVIFGDLFELNNAFLVRNNELVLFSVLVAITRTIKDITQETIAVLVDRNFKNAAQEVILPGLNKNIIVKDIIQNVLLPQLNKLIKGIIQEVVLPDLQQSVRSINMESDVIELNKPEKDLKFDDILFTLEEQLRNIGLDDTLIKLDKQIQHIVKDKIYELNTLIRNIAIFDLIPVYIDKKVPLWKEGLINLIAPIKNLTLFDISVYNKIKYVDELKPIYLDGKAKEIVTSAFLRPFIRQGYLKLWDLALLDKYSKEIISLVIGDLDKYDKELIKLVLKDFDDKIKELLLDLSFDKFKVDKQKFNLIDDKIFLLDAIYNIYVHRNNIIEVTRLQDELIYIPYPFIYTNFYRRWYFMPSDGPYDRIILPQDYPYETIPYNGVNQHPIPNGKDKALEEIDVDINIIANVIDFCHELWIANSFLYSRYTPEQALKHFVNTLFDWLDKYVPDVIEKLPEYYEDYELYPNPDTVRQDYWRIYKLIRWYAEAFILNVPHEDKNQLLGNKYVKYLIQDLIKYFNDHHGVYGPPGEKIFDKVKGIRHKWLTEEQNKLV